MDDTRTDAPEAGDRSTNVTERVVADESDGHPLSTAVVRVTAEHTGNDPYDMTPLYDVIDTDALEALFRPLGGRPGRRVGSVEFDYHGCRVSVDSEGRVSVRDHLRS